MDSFVRSDDYYAVNAPLSAPTGYQNPPLTNVAGASSYQSQHSGGSLDCSKNCDFCYNPSTGFDFSISAGVDKKVNQGLSITNTVSLGLSLGRY